MTVPKESRGSASPKDGRVGDRAKGASSHRPGAKDEESGLLLPRVRGVGQRTGGVCLASHTWLVRLVNGEN